MNWLSILSFIHTLTHITLSFINHSFCNMCKNTHTHYWLLISNRFKCNLGTSCRHRQTSTPDTTSSPSDRMKGGCGAPAPRCRLSDNFGIGHGHLRDGIFFLQSVCQTAVRLNQTNFFIPKPDLMVQAKGLVTMTTKGRIVWPRFSSSSVIRRNLRV